MTVSTTGATTAIALAMTFAGVSATAGCRGDRGDAADDDDGGESGGTADDGGDGGSEGDDEGEPGACDSTPGRVGLKRLTRAEYNRTVRDLFDVTSGPADVFPPDSVTNGFDNNADSLTVSPQLAGLLLDTAETVAAIAMVKRGDTIITCDPATDPGCAADTLRTLARRVYRRPPSDAEVDQLQTLVDVALDEGETFQDAIEYALSAMLVAPQFLYRGVPAQGNSPLADGEIAALTDHALASRLSYFLWGSTPDDALLARADAGALSDPETLRLEFDRMLADDKASALYDSFATQWLQLGKLGAAWPDPAMYPEFTDTLRDDMLAETRLFFEDLVARDGSVVEIVNGTETFANGPLAQIYGMDGVTGDTLNGVSLDPQTRAGVLTMPAVLTMLSNPTTPNIVRRGVWLAETMLCAAPPPPPDDVPQAPEPVVGETERERLERHRADPSCASCHNLIDPLGFAFENYDALGYWRTEDAEGNPVDNLGEMPDGSTFNGVVELAEQLVQGDAFGRCVTGKLLTYSLGRAVGPDDQCTVEQIASTTVTEDATMSDLLWAVATSDAFVLQQGTGGN